MIAQLPNCPTAQLSLPCRSVASATPPATSSSSSLAGIAAGRRALGMVAGRMFRGVSWGTRRGRMGSMAVAAMLRARLGLRHL